MCVHVYTVYVYGMKSLLHATRWLMPPPLGSDQMLRAPQPNGARGPLPEPPLCLSRQQITNKMASGRGCGRKEHRGNKLHGHKAAMSQITAEIKRLGLPEARDGARQVPGRCPAGARRGAGGFRSAGRLGLCCRARRDDTPGGRG